MINYFERSCSENGGDDKDSGSAGQQCSGIGEAEQEVGGADELVSVGGRLHLEGRPGVPETVRRHRRFPGTKKLHPKSYLYGSGDLIFPL